MNRKGVEAEWNEWRQQIVGSILSHMAHIRAAIKLNRGFASTCIMLADWILITA
jgi:hypothetical protein